MSIKTYAILLLRIIQLYN